MSSPSGAADASAAATAASLSALDARRAAAARLSDAEQALVHHALYAGVAAAGVTDAKTASAPIASPASPTSAAAYAPPSRPLFAPSTPSRLTLSVRANSLPSPSWLSEASTLVALFQLDDSATHVDTGAVGGAGTTHGSTFQLRAQSEVVRECNAPQWRSQFALERSSNPRWRRSRAHYMLRVYDVEESATIDEAGYLGLVSFDLEEVLQNCRARGSQGGEFVSVTLPLLHPSNKALHESLVANDSSLTLSLQIPREHASTPATSVVTQASFEYTRLINFLAPNILATYMDVRLALDNATAAGSSSAAAAAVQPGSTLLTVWYRARSTALFRFLASLDPAEASSSTLVLSDEALMVEIASLGQDDAEQGFEVRFLLLDRAKLLATLGLGDSGLDARRAAHKVMARYLDADPTPNEEADAVTPSAASPFLGGAAVSFRTIQTALDSREGLVLTLGAWASDAPKVAQRKLRLTVATRAPLAAPSGDEDASAAGSTVPASAAAALAPTPSLPASVPAAVLSKAHSALHAGFYFTHYAQLDADEDHPSPRAGPVRNVLLQLVDGVAEGADLPTRLQWRDAEPAPGVDVGASTGSMHLASIEQIIGGAGGGDAFTLHFAARASRPADDRLVTLLSRSGAQLCLEAPSASARHAFIFAVLSFQQQSNVRVASWIPAHASAATPAVPEPKIVVVEKITAAERQTMSLGGSHGSLRRASAMPSRSGTLTKSDAGSGGASGSVDLSGVLSKLEKVFEDGRNFIRFTAGAHKPFYISLWLRKVAASEATGFKSWSWLHWCKADDRVISETRVMRTDEITGIALGKQSGVFRKEEAALAPASHCFSIISERQSLHLQSWSERDTETFAFGIASLLKQSGLRPKLWQAGQYLESFDRLQIENAAERKEDMTGIAAIDPSDIPSLANAQGFKCTVELQVKCRQLGGQHGNYIVCVFDKREGEDTLTYLAQTEKQSRSNGQPDFKKPFKLVFESQHASRKLRFNVYDIDPSKKAMDEEDRIGSCMIALKEIVEQTGVEFVYKLTHETSAKQASLLKQGSTIIVTCATKSEMALVS